MTVEVAGLPVHAAHAAIDAAFAAVALVQARMSAHHPASDLGRWLRAPVGRRVAVHPWTHAVLRLAQRLFVQTGGLYDVTVAGRLAALGYLPKLRGRGGRAACGSLADVELCGDGTVRRLRPVRVDLGGIAKGYAVDQAIAALRRHGARSGLVNAGGDLATFGAPVRMVGLRHPLDAARIAAYAEIQDGALAASAATYTRRRVGDRVVTPFIDPRSGRSVRVDEGACVSAPTCVVADALTKVVLLDEGLAATLLDRYAARALIIDAAGRVREVRRAPAVTPHRCVG